MKNVISVLFAVLLTCTAFGIDERKEAANFVIHSDEVDSSVAAGFCIIEGQVLYAGVPVASVNVQSFKSNTFTTTDREGNFTITVDTSENGIYTTHGDFLPNYLEIYEFKSGHKIVMHFNLKKPKTQISTYPHAVKKPVIYAYGETSLSFEMSVNTKAEITFTYPKLNDKWEMTLAENGLIEDKNNNKYPYLFWEGEMRHLNYRKTDNKVVGSIVTKENTVTFLEEQLSQLGFNATEKTDFITFWSPLIMKNNKSFIQFLVDEEYEAISTMDINPKPNNIRRVYLLFSDANEIDDSFISAKNEFKSFDRNGFTILEWGGTEITNLKKL